MKTGIAPWHERLPKQNKCVKLPLTSFTDVSFLAMANQFCEMKELVSVLNMWLEQQRLRLSVGNVNLGSRGDPKSKIPRVQRPDDLSGLRNENASGFRIG